MKILIWFFVHTGGGISFYLYQTERQVLGLAVIFLSVIVFAICAAEKEVKNESVRK